MEDLSKYYTDIERELLSLIDYHLKYIADMAGNGTEVPDKDKKTDMLIHLKESIHEEAIRRKDRDEDELKEKKLLLESRQSAHCPECNETRAVKILDKKKDKYTGWIYDNVRCLVCGYKFVNPIPNNMEDRLKWSNSIIQKLEDKYARDAEKIPNPETKKVLESMKEEQEKAIMSKQQKMIFEEDLKQHEMQVQKKTEYLHDYLLIAKFRGISWKIPDKFLD